MTKQSRPNNGPRLTHSPICDECQKIRATGSHTKCSQVRQAKYAQGNKV